MFMMSRGRHAPAGHGSGKFVADSIALRIPRVDERESCSRVTVVGVISLALAASDRMPTELWKYGAVRKPPCHQVLYSVFVSTPRYPAVSNSARPLFPMCLTHMLSA